MRLPACDIGWPYLARLAGVSATGPLVTIEAVTEAPVASVVVTEVDVAVPTGAGAGSVEAGSEGGTGVTVVVVVVCWATAAPPIRAVAAAMVSKCWMFMGADS